ncbi:hypothetical protein CLOBOL_03283 [Enterocloster bolteae ATCC BAA-613]|uniref:Uncharacterized protein n=1 Tax=Enterocloster bolteae (strain ATCC BAA-613 / DSM 15670 / CCUG 46953 / JCM 12243 / WAL 16351) TaxID=411902 RepID=A8RSD3_ENTBW|nr:hypothetical protein CLOBOL_03283 [Enterocloster bolteae ATCC BAA-613]
MFTSRISNPPDIRDVGSKQRTILCLFESFCCRWQQFYGRIIKNSRLEGGT